MPAWCTSSTLYKGLFILVVTVVSIQYLYGPITEFKQPFLFNTTRTPQHQHSPMIKNRNKSIEIKTKNKVTKIPSIITGGNYTVKPPTTTSTNPEAITENSQDLEHNANTTVLPLCPEVSSHLRGRIDVVKSPVPTVKELENRFFWLKPGGHWLPDTCRVLKKVALIIPFRCREQDGDGPFNRAMLMNIGYKEALKIRNFDCFIFHDIDLLPEDDRNLYTCPHEQPRHMSVAVDIFKYKLPYPAIFGGVSAINRDHFRLLNGFSNSFWGWGGEDDDMSNRIRYHNLFISRYPLTIARYTMLTHKKDKPSPTRYDVLKQGQKRFDKDGLNSLQYTLLQTKENFLYTWILVAIETPS